MNHQVSQYRQLTASIKTWMQDCRSPSNNSPFYNILSAYRGDKKESSNEIPTITANEINSEMKGYYQPPATDLQPAGVKICNKCNLQKPERAKKPENIDTSIANTTIFSESELSFKTTVVSENELSFKTANDSIFVEVPEVPNGIPKRNYEKYPESIRHQIKFFETHLTFQEHNKTCVGPACLKEAKKPEPAVIQDDYVSNLVVTLKPSTAKFPAKTKFQQARENNVLSHLGEKVLKHSASKPLMEETPHQTYSMRPVVTHTILKEQVLNKLRAIHEQTELRDELTYPVTIPSNTPWVFKATTSKPNCPLPKRNEEEEKFVVNLYERRTSKKWQKVKADVNSGITKINSKLYIQDHPITAKGKDDGSDSSSSAETCIYRNAKIASNRVSDKSVGDMDSSSLSRSTISALLDKTESSVDVTLNETLVSSGTGNLEQEVHNQCRIMQQATKAVEMCNNVKELAGGKEKLEAERVLLLAGLKRSLLLNKLREVQYGGPKIQQKSGGARLTISEMEFPLMLPEDHHDYQIWYIITCSCESILQASQLIPRKRYCHYLNFSDSFTFGNVNPRSTVNLKVYQVKIRNNQNSKRRMTKLCCFNQTNVCSRRAQKVQYKDAYSGMVVQSQILPSIFTLCGSLDIPVDRLINNKNFLLDSTPNDSTLFGSLKLTTEVTNVPVNLTHAGFLTVGVEEKNVVTWDRKWCRLEGTTMQFWDHPSEEGLNTPKIDVDLKNSMEDEVADEYISRRRVLLLKVANFQKADESLVTRTYFLASDSNKELKIWKKRVNSVLTSLRLWKCFDA